MRINISITKKMTVGMMRLTGKVAIVTGASSGIGHATAKLFAGEGAQVVVGARRTTELDRLVAEIDASGGKAVALSGDVCNEGYARALVDLAETTFGGLDIAFNNAGTLGEMGPTTEVSAASFTDTVTTNLIAAFLGAKYQVPGDAQTRRGLAHFHLEHRGPYRWISRCRQLLRQQIRPHRPDAVARDGIRPPKYSRECDFARRRRYAALPADERHDRGAEFHRRPACPQACLFARGTRPLGAVSRFRRFLVHDGRRAGCRRWHLDQPHLNASRLSHGKRIDGQADLSDHGRDRRHWPGDGARTRGQGIRGRCGRA